MSLQRLTHIYSCPGKYPVLAVLYFLLDPEVQRPRERVQISFCQLKGNGKEICSSF